MVIHFCKFVNNPHVIKLLYRAVPLLLFLLSVLFILYSPKFSPGPRDTPYEKLSEEVTSTPTASSSTHDILLDFPEVFTPDRENVVVPEVMKFTPEPSAPEPTSFTTQSSSTPIEVGVFAGSIPELHTFEHTVGTQMDIVASSIHWGNESDFPETYANLVTKRGTTLFIYWYPMDYNKKARDQDAFHFSEILEGKWDQYIDTFADRARQNGGNIVIAPFEEVNGNWTYWNGVSGTYGTKEEYVQTFRYVREKFRNVPNVRFAWIVNQVSVPDTSENSITSYYPGDAYVDIIGINAFNFGTPWLSFDTLISRAVGEVFHFQKPIYITSTASAEGSKKATWIQDMFKSEFFSNGALKGLIWFNENKEHDWRVWSDESSLRSFVSNLK